jgi:hypothetical protein
VAPGGEALAEGPESPESEAANLCATQGWDRVTPLLAELERADAFEIDARLRRAIALEQQLDSELAPLLVELARTRARRGRGFPSLESFARERLGLSPRKARALLRIERAAAGCPALRAAFRSARLSWVQVQALLPVLPLCDSTQARARWIARAEQISVRRLEDEVDRALGAGAGEPERHADRPTCAQSTAAETSTPTGADPVSGFASEPAPAPVCEPETARFFFAAPPDVARLFRAVVCSVRRQLERAKGRLPSEGAALEWMFDHAYEAWGANNPRVRREHRIFERDGWRCTVPAAPPTATSRITTSCCGRRRRARSPTARRLRLAPPARRPRRLRPLPHGPPCLGSASAPDEPRCRYFLGEINQAPRCPCQADFARAEPPSELAHAELSTMQTRPCQAEERIIQATRAPYRFTSIAR